MGNGGIATIDRSLNSNGVIMATDKQSGYEADQLKQLSGVGILRALRSVSAIQFSSGSLTTVEATGSQMAGDLPVTLLCHLRRLRKSSPPHWSNSCLM
jgi:hypothetical protein